MKEVIELNKKIGQLLDVGEYEKAKSELEIQVSKLVHLKKQDLPLLAEIAGSLITVGSESYDAKVVEFGLKLFEDNKEVLKQVIHEDSINYCIGNGLHALYKISIKGKPYEYPNPQNIKDFLFEAKCAHLKSFKQIDLSKLNFYSIQVLTNLGNNLNHSGRIVEALQLFDLVLQFNPDFPQAVASKADTLVFMVRTTQCPLTISLFYTMYSLFLKASENLIPIEEVRQSIELGLQKSYEFLKENNFNFDDLPQELALNKLEYFRHSDEIKFFLDNFLSLSEHGLYCKCNGAKTDDLIIGYSGFKTDNTKLMRLELILNRLKSEFSLSRTLFYEYLSSYEKDNIHYEHFFDGTLNGIHLEKLRTSFRLCFGILDKIAKGICYLLDLEVGIKENIYFENFWNNPRGPKDRWEKINSYRNIHLSALYSIATDLNSATGEFGYYKEWRNILEHGIFSIKKIDTDYFKLLSEKGFTDYSFEKGFIDKTKHLLQLTRAAIFSYVFCVRQELVVD